MSFNSYIRNETSDIVPSYTSIPYFCHSARNFIFSTDLCRYQNVLKCIPSNIEVDKTTIYMPYSERLFNSLMNVYISDDHVTSQKP